MQHLSLFFCQSFQYWCDTGTPPTGNYWWNSSKLKNHSDHFGIMRQWYVDGGCQLSLWLINLLWLVKFSSSLRHLHIGSLLTHSVCKSRTTSEYHDECCVFKLHPWVLIIDYYYSVHEWKQGFPSCGKSLLNPDLLIYIHHQVKGRKKGYMEGYKGGSLC